MARLVGAQALGIGIAGSVPTWGDSLCPLKLESGGGNWTWSWEAPSAAGLGGSLSLELVGLAEACCSPIFLNGIRGKKR